MSFFKRKKTTDAAKGIQKQAYMQERLKLAGEAGKQQARDEHKRKKKGGGMLKGMGSFANSLGGPSAFDFGVAQPSKKKQKKGPFGF